MVSPSNRGDFVDEGTLDELVRFRQYGHEYDPDLELSLAGGQFYAPGAGRLMSPNAAAELAGQNPYRFAGNSPERVTGAGSTAQVTSNVYNDSAAAGYSYYVNPLNDFREGRWGWGLGKSLGWTMFAVGSMGAGLLVGAGLPLAVAYAAAYSYEVRTPCRSGREGVPTCSAAAKPRQ